LHPCFIRSDDVPQPFAIEFRGPSRGLSYKLTSVVACLSGRPRRTVGKVRLVLTTVRFDSRISA
jgi:hypothetical protein